MARLKSWRWWAPLLAAAAIVAVFLPGGMGPAFQFREPRRTQSRAVDRAVSRLRTRIAHEETRDAQLRLAERRQHVTRGNITVSYISPATAEQAADWADAVLRDTETSLGVRQARGRVVVLLASWDSIQRLAQSRNTYFGQGMIGRAADPCFAVIESNPDRLQYVRDGNAPVTLGSCSMVLAFGAPGAAARSWYRQDRWSWDPLAGISTQSLLAQPRTVRRFDASPALVGCVQRIEDACTRMMTEDFGESAVGWLIHQFGADAFGRFWAHTGSLDEAARDAFGASLADLSRLRLTTQFEVAFGAGPRMGGGDLLLGGISIALFVALAAVAGRRRQVA